MTIAPPERGKTLLAVLTAIAVALEKPEMLKPTLRAGRRGSGGLGWRRGAGAERECGSGAGPMLSGAERFMVFRRRTEA